MTTLTLDVVVDVVCPWCYVGKRRLEKAMAATPDIDYVVRYRPFQLDPGIPPQGLERRAYITAKLGGADRVATAHARLAEIGAADGIPFRFEAITVAPNTLDAHRVIRWAAEAEVQADVTERLFRTYFVEGGDIGDRATLARVAQDAGMAGAEVRQWLDTEEDLDSVRAEIEQAARMGITGVPCTLIERKYAVTGAQDAAVLAEAFREIAEEKRFGAKS
ncbi:DsbA family oxidoreductase [Prosthecomicrobium sp. N25]|uniref:DsbA family oxidoreductase n=1 Tax=Prosthecomicrobium sp. N25 TaxID=3129254 RepID=UPI0030772425